MIIVFKLSSDVSTKKDVLPIATSCKNLQEGVLKWSALVRLPKPVVEKNYLNPETAVRDQIKYLDGFFHFAKYEQPRLILLHDLSIQIDSVNPSEEGSIVISYSAEKPVAFCQDSAQQLETLNLSLPYDPYSAYDLVPVHQRRVLSSHGESHETNPCADPEITLNAKPDLYWYTWQPQARGVDASGQAYDCRSILKDGADYQTVQGQILLKPSKEITNAFQPLAGLENWKVSLVFGFVSGEAEEKTLRDAKKFFAIHPNLESAIFEDKKTQDAAVWAVLNFFDELKKIANIVDYQVVDRSNHIKLMAVAQLKSSQKTIAIEVFLGSTEVKATAVKDFLTAAMRTSQIIFYIGHSGAGSRIDWTSLQTSFPAQQPYQILGVIGCYSTEYFNPLYADFRQSHGLKTVLLRTDFSGYRYLLPIGLLGYLDHDQKPGAASLTESLSNYLEADEKVLVQQF